MLFILFGLLIVIGLLAAFAWKLSQEERRRSDGRVAALVASLEDDPRVTTAPELALRGAGDAPEPGGDDSRGGIFGAGPGADRHPIGWPLVAGAAVLVLAAGAAVTLVRLPAAAAGAAADRPLELLSLTSVRQGADLTVAGLVRNPAPGAARDRLAAVVLCFDAQGRFLTSSRALLDVQALAPGDESRFRITMPAPEGVNRYRVSFRRAEGDVVPHVDRRASRGGASGGLEARARQAGA